MILKDQCALPRLVSEEKTVKIKIKHSLVIIFSPSISNLDWRGIGIQSNISD